jgi:hypothetical protein
MLGVGVGAPCWPGAGGEYRSTFEEKRNDTKVKRSSCLNVFVLRSRLPLSVIYYLPRGPGETVGVGANGQCAQNCP